MKRVRFFCFSISMAVVLFTMTACFVEQEDVVIHSYVQGTEQNVYVTITDWEDNVVASVITQGSASASVQLHRDCIEDYAFYARDAYGDACDTDVQYLGSSSEVVLNIYCDSPAPNIPAYSVVGEVQIEGIPYTETLSLSMEIGNPTYFTSLAFSEQGHFCFPDGVYEDEVFDIHVLQPPPGYVCGLDQVIYESTYIYATVVCVTNTPVCGNGILEAGEQCEDGNNLDGDGCSATCTCAGAPVCGNGVQEAGEQCDDGNLDNGDGCSATCLHQWCGNQTVEEGEQCDDGNTMDDDGCSSSCQKE